GAPANVWVLEAATGAAPALVMRTLSSPSWISSSPIPDDSTSSISVLSLRRSTASPQGASPTYSGRPLTTICRPAAPVERSACNGLASEERQFAADDVRLSSDRRVWAAPRHLSGDPRDQINWVMIPRS